jgi:carboxymethylenebutenolidase
MKRFYTAVILFLLSGCLSTGESSLDAKRLQFVADGQRMDVLQYAADGDETRPAIVLLHGASGYERLRRLYERHAALLVSSGYRVYALRYYDEHDKRVMTGADREAQQRNYERRVASWLYASNDAIDHISRLPHTDSGRIAILGFSQGAYLAIGVAATNERVAAVVDMYGGIPAAWAAKIHRLPPVLIVHGEADKIVPVSEAYSLAAFLDSIGTKYEIKTYTNAGHGFDAKKGSLEADDAMRQVVQFLDRTLKFNRQ